VSRRPGISLGRLAGVPVYLAPSWFVVALVVVVVFAPQVEQALGVGPPDTYVVAGLYAVLLLVSVLVHEFAHALTARALGLPVEQVVADLWGGHTQFTDDAPTPGRSALVAVVGPLANGAIALAGYLALPPVGSGPARLLLVALVLSNAFVAVFNLAPGLPLDGGRVVESIVWAVSGRRWAGTLAAGWSGRVVAVAVIAWGLLLPIARGEVPSTFSIVWSVMIGLLLWQGASGAIALGRLRRGAARLDLPRHTEPATGAPAAGEQWRGTWPAHRRPHVVAVDDHGSPVGVLLAEDAERLLAAPTPPPPGTPLSAVMTVLDPVVVVEAGASGEDVLRAVAGTPARLLVVVGPDATVVGLADVGAIAAALTGHP
jgi:Zn-dependent protease